MINLDGIIIREDNTFGAVKLVSSAAIDFSNSLVRHWYFIVTIFVNDGPDLLCKEIKLRMNTRQLRLFWPW